MNQPAADFDFDEWVCLAQTDPEAFERRRRALIDELIVSAPERLRQRLHGLQFQIDMERRRSRTPYASCLRVSRMMWQMFVGEDGFRATLCDFAGQNTSATLRRANTAPIQAKVLPFAGRPKAETVD
jgi:Protein of unknown function (DUF3135)